jgi:inner membrane protein
VALQEIAISDWVSRLPQNSYISGSLLLDDMEDVRIPLEIERYASLRLFGGQVELSNARPSQVAAVLGEFWILVGKVVVKVRQ